MSSSQPQNVLGTTALTGDGVQEGIEWLVEALNRFQRRDAAARVRGEPGDEEKNHVAGDGAVARSREVLGGRRQAGADRRVTRNASPRFYA